jgi:hypothetical protein
MVALTFVLAGAKIKNCVSSIETTLEKLKAEMSRIQHRLDRLYIDKLDEKITQEFYDENFQRFSKEKEQIAKQIAKHSKSGTEYIGLANNIYELSQKGREIYESAGPEEKRDLIKLVFGRLSLDGEKLDAKYSKPFELLSCAVQNTNRIQISSENLFAFKIFNIFSELHKTLMDKRKNTNFVVDVFSWLDTR